MVWLEEGNVGHIFITHKYIRSIIIGWRGTMRFQNSQNRHHYLTFQQIRLLYNCIFVILIHKYCSNNYQILCHSKKVHHGTPARLRSDNAKLDLFGLRYDLHDEKASSKLHLNFHLIVTSKIFIEKFYVRQK